VDAVLAGNIGQPLLEIPAGTATVVAELSSYQCARLDHSPAIAVVTNLFEEHIPWHGSVPAYWADKARIFSQGADFLVCDRVTLDKFSSVEVLGGSVTVRVVDDDSILPDLPPELRAPHNLHNVRCALAAAGLRANLAAGLDAFAGYQGLPHRLETVSVSNGVTWVDDTLSTTPESVIAAAEAFRDHQSVVLIVGGQSRGISYRVLTDYLCAHADAVRVIAIPSNGPAATAEFAERFPDRWQRADNLADAVALAARMATPGAAVILSPGAPSFDHYRDYADKSRHYADAVRSLLVVR
jgi:UDP-N-acetylmuramoylalanine--D-glutamate ligase